MHISDPAEKAWLQQRIEGPDKEISFSKEGRLAILQKLVEAEAFEQLIHKRYPGTKRFGVDGAESLLPALEQISSSFASAKPLSPRSGGPCCHG